jgi:putative ABC transport system permease protein
VLALVRNWPGVARTDVLRSVDVDSPQGSVHIAATDNPTLATERVYLSRDVPVDQIQQRLEAGAVLVSEPFANRMGMPRHGGEIELYTANGLKRFPVAAIYYDYASTQGTVLMALPVYQEAWQDASLTAAALRLAPGSNPDQVASQLQEKLAQLQRLEVRPNRALRQEVLVVFDRTFAITGALQLLATVVAFIGVLSALFSLELERQRELGILRSIGMPVRQVGGLILLETGLMGAAAGLLSMPTGYVLAVILVYIINRRSFGWTLQMQVLPAPFIQALVVAVIAALLAGIYPAVRMARISAAEALRGE